MTRLVITGVGACSAVGDTSLECFESFLSGTKGNKNLQHLDLARYNKKIAYERTEVGEHKGKFRSSSFLSRALREAINSSAISAEQNIPVYVGTGLRELRTVELAALNGETISLEDLDFTRAVKGVLPNSQHIYTISNACAASNFAIALACDSIKLGRTDIAIAAGCDTLTSSMFGLLDRVNPLNVEVLQVFEKSRKGVLMGDGGVALVIERLESALANGRKPLAEIKSVGLSSDAVHETAPDQVGIIRALNDAYQRAGISPQNIDLIYVHGTGTDLNDATESASLASVYRQFPYKPALCGIKAMTGHTSGASGGIGVVAAVYSLQQQIIPPTPGTVDVVDHAKVFPIFATAKSANLEFVQINAFGFGGVNAVVILQKYGDV